MTGLVALQGGVEHTPGCEPIDEHLLAHVPRSRPQVLVVPLASSRRTVHRTVATAVAWWSRLGAVVTDVRDAGPAADAVEWADVVVLTGGVPDRLQQRLGGSALWAQIAAAWRAGTHLSGSSSGAMVLGAAFPRVRAPLTLEPGLGLLPGVVVVPHHDRHVAGGVASFTRRTRPGLTVLGIDERTAVVGRGGHFVVVGTGQVVVARGASERRLAAGAPVWLPDAAVRRDDGPLDLRLGGEQA